MNLGAAFAGGNGHRRADDFYPTPPEATHALLLAEGWRLPHNIWEPACGDGAISRVLKAAGRNVYSSDLVARGYGDVGDFLDRPHPPLGGPYGIVTNPPFKHAAAFIERACDLSAYVAMLLKCSFWNAAARVPLYRKFTPTRIYPLTWRLDFDGRGRPTMDCMWVVWDRGCDEGAVFRPIERPWKDIFA